MATLTKPEARRALFEHAEEMRGRGWTPLMWWSRAGEMPEAEALPPREVEAIVDFVWRC